MLFFVHICSVKYMKGTVECKTDWQNEQRGDWRWSPVCLCMPVALAMVVSETRQSQEFNHCESIEISYILLSFEIWRLSMKQLFLLNGIQIHLSMKVEDEPRQKEEYSINLYPLLKGLHFPETDRKHGSTRHWAMKQRTLDQRRKKTTKKKPECLKMLHHVCLIPFCIIDMNYWYDSCKVFFKQLNNLLLSMLPQRVPDLDKKLLPPLFCFFLLFLWDSQWVTGLLPLSPHWKETCTVLWTKIKNRIWSWAE